MKDDAKTDEATKAFSAVHKWMTTLKSSNDYDSAVDALNVMRRLYFKSKKEEEVID